MSVNANNSNNDERDDEENTERKVNVYRFKFTDEVSGAITAFAKTHQYDDRHEYKEAWQEWLEDNSDLVEEETNRLRDLGYDKDVGDKMFKSGRYYFRKKSRETVKPVKRRDYITIDQSILLAMDNHISCNMNNDDYTPARGYDTFCSEEKELLSREIVNLMKTKKIYSEDLTSKIKKTYKNRYFMLSRAGVDIML
jgi:hypothetical protein